MERVDVGMRMVGRGRAFAQYFFGARFTLAATGANRQVVTQLVHGLVAAPDRRLQCRLGDIVANTYDHDVTFNQFKIERWRKRAANPDFSVGAMVWSITANHCSAS